MDKLNKLENQAILEKILRENPLYKDVNGNTSLGKCIEILSTLPKKPSILDAPPSKLKN